MNKIVKLDITQDQLSLLKKAINEVIKINKEYLKSIIDTRQESAYVVDKSNSKGLYIHLVESTLQRIIELEKVYTDLTVNTTDNIYLANELTIHTIECIIDDCIIKEYRELDSEKEISFESIIELEKLHKNIIELLIKGV